MSRDPVSFLDEHQNPTMLRTLLSATIEGKSWKEPWTSDATVGHKINLRLEVGDHLSVPRPHFLNIFLISSCRVAKEYQNEASVCSSTC